MLGTIKLEGKPEFAASDGKGEIFVNIEDKSQLDAIDPNKLEVKSRWPLAPCQEPSGLSMDRKNRRLFVGCDNKMMAVVDADSGKVLATPAESAKLQLMVERKVRAAARPYSGTAASSALDSAGHFCSPGTGQIAALRRRSCWKIEKND